MFSLPKFFIPKHKHFGLAIGRTSLRAIELTDSGAVKLLVEMVIPLDVFAGGVLVKKDIFVDALRKLIIAGKFTTPYVAVGFSEIYAYDREYSVPKIAKEEIYEAVSWHVKDLFPFPEEELYFDWKILETTDQGYKIAVVAVQKKILDPLVEALTQAGLKPLCFEPGASAIAQLLRLKPEEHALVTEVNKRGAYVTLVEGEKAIFTTVINYTGNDNQETYLNNICQTITDIANFYKEKGVVKPSEKISVVLTGELATKDLSQKIFSCTNFVTNLLMTITQNPAFNKAYAVAAGKIAPPVDPETINLLPQNLQEYYDQERKTLFYKSLLIRVSIGMALIFLLAVGAFLAVSNLRISLDNRSKYLNNATKTSEVKTQNLLLLNAQAKDIVTLAPLRKTPKDQLIAISNLLTDKITITQWEYDDEKLSFTLDGIAATREDLLTFKDQLETSKTFTNIVLPLGSLEMPEDVHFTISFISNQ